MTRDSQSEIPKKTNNNFKIINNFWYSIGKKAKDKYKEIVNGQAV
jgi:hypothetical protein